MGGGGLKTTTVQRRAIYFGLKMQQLGLEKWWLWAGGRTTTAESTTAETVDHLGGFAAVGTQLRGISLFPLVP